MACVVLAAGAFVAGCGGDDGSSPPPSLAPGETPMPDVDGLRLDIAKADLADAGLEEGRVEVIGGGAFGVVDDSNWVVCDQEPDAGYAVGSKARVSVDREGECGDGDSLD